MPSPTSALTTLRPDLATYFEFDLEMEKAGFIAAKVMPVVEVASQAGVFGKIPIEQLLSERDTARAPVSGYARGSFTFTPSSFTCLENGAEEPVDDREAKMYAEYFDAELISTMRAFGAVLRNAEKRVADAVFNATTWTSNTTAITNEWDDLTNAVPITDVEAAVQAVYTASGLWPNAIIINRKVFRNLRNCDQIIARIAASGAGSPTAAGLVTEQQLAEVFDLDHVIVAGSSRNSAIEGQTATPVQIWSDEYAMVCKIATGGDMKEPCIGRTFHWAEDGSSIGGTVETYRDEPVRSDVVRVRHDTDEIVLHVEAGHLLSNVTT